MSEIRCKAILFDMDGTLVDSTAIVERAWGNWAARHNLSLSDILAFSHGRPTISTLEQFRPGQDHTSDLEELARFEENETAGILAVPGAAEILDTMQRQNHPWALVTSAWRKLAETRVLAAGLPFPTVIVHPEEEETAEAMHGVIWDLAAHGYVAIAADYQRRIEGQYRPSMFAWKSTGDLTLIIDATAAGVPAIRSGPPCMASLRTLFCGPCTDTFMPVASRMSWVRR